MLVPTLMAWRQLIARSVRRTGLQGELSLETIAEISIALAGFSGLIAMVRSGPVHDWHPRVRLAFWISLDWSVTAVVLSLLPSLLNPLGLSSWSFLNGVAGLVLISGLALMLRSHMKLNLEGAPTQNPWHWVVNTSIIVIGALGTLAGLAGVGSGASFEWYRFGTISCLLAALPGFLASFRVRGAAPAG
jgi:hypothetical protein